MTKLAGLKDKKTGIREKDRLVHDLRTHQMELEMQNEQLRQLQEKLEDSRDRYYQLFDIAPVGYLIVDKQGIITECNRTAVFMLGKARTRLLKTPLSRFVKIRSRDDFYRHMIDVFSRRTRQTCEIELLRPERKSFFARLESITMHDYPHPSPRALVALIDITDKKEAEIDLAEHHEKLSRLFKERTRMLDRERAQKEQLSAASLRLSEALREKEVLLKELYHRTKNNMNVISSLLFLQMTSMKKQNPELVQAMKDTQNRIQAMSLVHEMLYKAENLTRIDIGDYVRKITRSIMTGFKDADGRIALDMKIAPMDIPMEKALPLGLVLNELITNSMKYAFPEKKTGRITIKIAKAGRRGMDLYFKDNGPGLPRGLDAGHAESLGLRLVNNIVTRQLDGTVEARNRRGAEFRIKIQDQAGD